jgi:tetratricopeptide (TPR) repeat protein
MHEPSQLNGRPLTFSQSLRNCLDRVTTSAFNAPFVMRDSGRAKIKATLSAIAVSLALSPSVSAHGPLHAQIEEVSRRIAQAPREAALYLKRGELHRLHTDWAAALADYRRARLLDPRLDVVDFCEGRALLEAGDLEPAGRALERFLSAHPDDVEALWLHARVEMGRGRPGAAAEEFARALPRLPAPRPDHFVELARALAASGRADQAVAALDSGLQRLGPVVALEMSAIDFELQLTRYDAALARLARILDRSPRKETWLMRRGEILARAGRSEEARQTFLQVQKAVEGLPPHIRATRAMRQLEQQCRVALAGLDTRPASAGRTR